MNQSFGSHEFYYFLGSVLIRSYSFIIWPKKSSFTNDPLRDGNEDPLISLTIVFESSTSSDFLVEFPIGSPISDSDSSSSSSLSSSLSGMLITVSSGSWVSWVWSSVLSTVSSLRGDTCPFEILFVLGDSLSSISSILGESSFLTLLLLLLLWMWLVVLSVLFWSLVDLLEMESWKIWKVNMLSLIVRVNIRFHWPRSYSAISATASIVMQNMK